MKLFIQRAILFFFIVFTIQSFLVRYYQTLPASLSPCIESASINNAIEGDWAIHNRSWTNSRSINGFCMNYELEDAQRSESRKYRESYVAEYRELYYEYWGNIYKALHESNKDKLSTLEDSLMNIKIERDLSRSEFAYMIVSFVQDIPYSYVLIDDCNEIEDGKPCEGNAKFGILSPVEFLYTLNGDCDTRTVLLYTLLSNLGYDPLILISREYLHSILALDIPASGEYLMSEGKKYYFWETTNKGWEPGMIAPDMKNKNYWNIALGKY